MSDDRDLRKYTRRGALGLMGIGGIVAVSETLGFSSLGAGRGVSIGISDDDSALLEITVDGNNSVNGGALNTTQSAVSPVEVTFTNNAGSDFVGDSLGTGSGLAVELSVNSGGLNGINNVDTDNTDFTIDGDTANADFQAHTDLSDGNQATLKLTNDDASHAEISLTIAADGRISLGTTRNDNQIARSLIVEPSNPQSASNSE